MEESWVQMLDFITTYRYCWSEVPLRDNESRALHLVLRLLGCLLGNTGGGLDSDGTLLGEGKLGSLRLKVSSRLEGHGLGRRDLERFASAGVAAIASSAGPIADEITCKSQSAQLLESKGSIVALAKQIIRRTKEGKVDALRLTGSHD